MADYIFAKTTVWLTTQIKTTVQMTTLKKPKAWAFLQKLLYG